MGFEIKRIYEAPGSDDGIRVLVDRLWPRGVSKERAWLDDWLKEVAPSNELRNWFEHMPERFEAFATRYKKELDGDPAKQEAVSRLLQWGKKGRVSLLYGAKDATMNQAAVLRAYLQERAGGES